MRRIRGVSPVTLGDQKGADRRCEEFYPFRRGKGTVVYELEGVLGPSVMRFVDTHVRSLLTWDILVFFHRNEDAVLDAEGLARRLGRRPEELAPEIAALIEDGILDETGGVVRYSPDPELHETICGFVDACQERRRRLALIALVLHKVNPRSN